MSKLNPTSKGSKSLFDDERLAGGYGMRGAKESYIQLLRRATLANLLWEDIAYMDGKSVSDEIARLIPLCSPDEVYDLAIEVRQKQKLRHTPLFIAVQMCRNEGHRALVSKFPGTVTSSQISVFQIIPISAAASSSTM